jgi:hypothetical protein
MNLALGEAIHPMAISRGASAPHFRDFYLVSAYSAVSDLVKKSLLILLGTGMILSAVWLAPHVACPMSKTYPYLQQSGAMIVRFIRWFDGSTR